MESSIDVNVDVRSKDADKFSMLKKIQSCKELLFGKFSPTVTKDAKDKKWEQIRQELIAEGRKSFEARTSKQIKDSWSVLKTRAVEKTDKAKKTGSGGVAKLSEVEKLVLAIVDAESPQIVGLDVSESGEAPTSSEQAGRTGQDKRQDRKDKQQKKRTSR